jgi:formyltetrahydrofolate-dependent phosphoribosylglycinamide formyltransferase
MSTELARLIVLLSGSGSNLQALIDACAAGELDARIVCVVSNRKAAYGLERAQAAGIETLYRPLKPYTDGGWPREAYDNDLAEDLKPYAPDLIVCVGWMHIFTPAFIEHFSERVINLHPALPGVLAGKDSLRETFDAVQHGAQIETGCMVHVVVPEVDAGRVIDIERVPVRADDTLATFAERMHSAEHDLIVRAVRSMLSQQRAC